MAVPACKGSVAVDLLQQSLACGLHLAKLGVMGKVDRLGLCLHDTHNGCFVRLGIELAWGAGYKSKSALGAVELAIRDAKGVAGENGIGPLIKNKDMMQGMAGCIPEVDLARAKPEGKRLGSLNNMGRVNGNHATVVTLRNVLGVDLADRLPELAGIHEMTNPSRMNHNLCLVAVTGEQPGTPCMIKMHMG